MNATWYNYIDVVDDTSMYALVSDSGETLVETLEPPTARQRADADDTWGVVSRDGVVVKTVSMGE